MREYEMMIGLLSEQSVACRPTVARVLDSVNAALFFQQIAFQAEELISEERDYSSWVYKTRTPHPMAEIHQQECDESAWSGGWR